MAGITEKSLFLSSLKFITKDIVGDILFFPVWWYSFGFKKITLSLLNNWRSLASGLSITTLFKHIGTPMYGDYTKSGRIISFFMRIIQLIFLTAGIVVYGVLLIVLIVAWLVIPLFVAYNIIYQLLGPF
ncbi:hypothetical protein KKI23_00220 [Patescibacteria group bacterium]|nr:hypothetical protein [Patescibacteria group bacterium]